METAAIPIHERVKDKALGDWGHTVRVGVAPKLGTFQLMAPAPLAYLEFWRLPEASVQAQRDAARAEQAVRILGARMPVIGYADVPRALRPTYAIRNAQEQKAVGLLGEQEAAVSNLPNSFQPENQRASSGRGRGGRGGRGAGRGGREGGVSQVTQASSNVLIEEMKDEWAVGTFRVIYMGQHIPWQIARIQRRPKAVDPEDPVPIMWYDRNQDSTTRFTRVPLRRRGGTDSVLVMSCGPTVMIHL